VARAALADCPAGAHARATLLANLGGALQSRYERTKRPGDLDATLDAFRAGLADTQERAPGRALLLNNLGITLAARARAAAGPGAVRDLTEAVAAHRSAARAAAAADRPLRLNNLAAALSDQYQATGRQRDLREALRIWRRSVAQTAPRAPQRARRLGNLARGYALRYDHRGRRRDLVRARALYRESCAAGLASDPESALAAGSEWGRWATGRAAYPEASQAYDLAADALDQLFRAQLLRPNKEAWLRAAGSAASAGSFAHARSADGAGAALAIERGRALLLSEALDRDRAEPAHLSALGHGDLAARYREVSQRVNRLLDTGGWPP
jgi:hypothetical protein